MRRGAAIAVSGLVLVAAFALINYFWPGTGPSDIGAFVGHAVHGGGRHPAAEDRLQRGLADRELVRAWWSRSARRRTGVLMLAGPAAAGRWRAAYQEVPLLRPVLTAIWLAGVLGWLADDSGVIVAARPAVRAAAGHRAGRPAWRPATRRGARPELPAGTQARPTGAGGLTCDVTPGKAERPPGTAQTGRTGCSIRCRRVIAGPFLRLLARPKSSEPEHIPASGGAILASNHLSIVDSIFLPLMLAAPVTFAAKSEYFTGTRLIDRATGAYLRATKQLSVDRAGARAAQDMLEAALGLLREGALFGIYPEGTRSPDGRLYRGRTGIGWLALHAGVPVLPVAMIGTDRVLPPGHKIPRPGRIEIRIGEPLTSRQYRDQPAGARQRRAVTER